MSGPKICPLVAPAPMTQTKNAGRGLSEFETRPGPLLSYLWYFNVLIVLHCLSPNPSKLALGYCPSPWHTAMLTCREPLVGKGLVLSICGSLSFWGVVCHCFSWNGRLEGSDRC